MIVQREDCNQDKREGAEAHQTNLIHRLLRARSLLQTYMNEHAQAARSYCISLLQKLHHKTVLVSVDENPTINGK
jgi:hypothetical protein